MKIALAILAILILRSFFKFYMALELARIQAQQEK